MKKALILILVLFTTLLLACSLSNAQTPITVLTIENKTWVLESYGKPGNVKSVLKSKDAHFKVTAKFDSVSGEVTGSGGLNSC